MNRFLTERRGKSAVTGSLGFTSMNGDFANPELEFSAGLGYKHYIEAVFKYKF